MNVLFSFIARHKKVCLSDVTIFLQPPMYYACPSNPALFFHPLTAKLLLSRVKPCRRHRFDGEMIAQMNLFRVPMIDHRQQFGGEMIALLN